ncbi:MAG: UDP-N-acetylglucosamine--N-acetylmuramyl-(pentapeptide) pyrophosphoryl-undecaprenol N-acetylglucosamine transferase [Verrucomicrobiota bacterium]|nr:MAG: UDP-N-acetylglucosamine--N-acetylmuramyl-(pentapeptide) pyrophosphoryl-undecaprenol N-acetylglucosamine transferase [Verrucomicrobiota bacterium]
MNILLACGGSGGHIAPAIALAERLPEHRCTFIISHKQVDTLFTEKYPQFEFIRIGAAPFHMSPLALGRFLRSQLTSLRFAYKFLKQRHIDLVISFGGFTSLGFVLAAKMRHIPIILHESNQIPGKSTRVLAKFANKIILPPEVFLKRHKYQTKTVSLDYPIRKEFVAISQADAREQLGWPALKKIVLILGGSNGALSLNKWAEQNFSKFAHHNLDFYCIAGTAMRQEYAVNHEDCTLHMLPFCHEMNLAIRASDLVISRAGAGAIAECRYCKRPMILVPYPLAADQHQRANARAAELLGVATMVEQDEIDRLAPKILEFFDSKTMSSAMQRALEITFVPDAAEQFAHLVRSML